MPGYLPIKAQKGFSNLKHFMKNGLSLVFLRLFFLVHPLLFGASSVLLYFPALPTKEIPERKSPKHHLAQQAKLKFRRQGCSKILLHPHLALLRKRELLFQASRR